MAYRGSSDGDRPLDPIAVTLAVWLALIVSVAGLSRMSENAAARAAQNQEAVPKTDETLPFQMRVMAFGG